MWSSAPLAILFQLSLFCMRRSSLCHLYWTVPRSLSTAETISEQAVVDHSQLLTRTSWTMPIDGTCCQTQNAHQTNHTQTLPLKTWHFDKHFTVDTTYLQSNIFPISLGTNIITVDIDNWIRWFIFPVVTKWQNIFGYRQSIFGYYIFLKDDFWLFEKTTNSKDAFITLNSSCEHFANAVYMNDVNYSVQCKNQVWIVKRFSCMNTSVHKSRITQKRVHHYLINFWCSKKYMKLHVDDGVLVYFR